MYTRRTTQLGLVSYTSQCKPTGLEHTFVNERLKCILSMKSDGQMVTSRIGRNRTGGTMAMSQRSRFVLAKSDSRLSECEAIIGTNRRIANLLVLAMLPPCS